MSTQKRGYLSFCKGALKKTLSRGWTLCYGVMICINVCVGMHSHLFLECVYSQQVSIPNAQVCFEVPWSWDELCYSRLMSGFLRLVGAAVSWEHTLLHQPDQTDPPPGLTHTHTHTHKDKKDRAIARNRAVKQNWFLEGHYFNKKHDITYGICNRWHPIRCPILGIRACSCLCHGP